MRKLILALVVMGMVGAVPAIASADPGHHHKIVRHHVSHVSHAARRHHRPHPRHPHR